ncbi:ATP-dependent DNA helicase DinG [Vibrio sp. RC27]
MLTSKVQKLIQKSYQNLPYQLDNFVPRRAQNYLVAEIAKTLHGQYHKTNRIMVAEAGTGIGKSLSYLMAAVPMAVLNNRKLIISTATVALQEQLAHKDLPLYRRLIEIDFQYRVAKGRQRYCCREKLAAFSESGDQLGFQFETKPEEDEIALLRDLYKALDSGKWDGERDSWPSTITNETWQRIASDKFGCNPTFSVHRQCPYHKARVELEAADVIIANHSLVLSDAELGGGVILPEPEESIYIFDEAHHLPQIAREHTAAFAPLKNSISWLERLNQTLAKFTTLAEEQRVFRFSNELTDAIQVIIPSLLLVSKHIDTTHFVEKRLRFEHGELPDWLQTEAKDLKKSTKKARQAVGKISDLISEKTKEGQLALRIAQPALAELGSYEQRLENLNQVWSLMAKPTSKSTTPLARWLEISEEREDDVVVHVSPIEVGYHLEQAIWTRCVGAVLTSATMRALNSFSYFCHQAGISQKEEDGVQFLALASPFDYQTQGELLVADIGVDPQAEDFTKKLVNKLPNYLLEKKANLVLFASYWQMNEVASSLSAKLSKKGWLIQIQGTKSRKEILDNHKFTIDHGGTSIIFGTGSFSEGLDLPGKLLENVIITKIPFAVPTSPIEQALAEYIESRGGNPFMQITVPEASKKLVQSAGRLLRKELDSGRVVILDRRIMTRRYGKALLDALPPFKRVEK